MKTITLTEKQTQIFLSTANEVFAGGSSGGGKTMVNKIYAIAMADAIPGVQIGILRNTSKNLKKNYLQGPNSFPDLLSQYIKSKKVSINYSDMTITWLETGSCIHLMHCDHVESTIENLTGLEFSGCIIVDEASLVAAEVIAHAKTRLRRGSLEVKDEFWAKRTPKLLLSSNPGGISHNYLKERYIHPAPPGTEFVDEYGKTLLFVPFGARENPHIDYEAYEREIRSSGDPVKAARLIEGDWDIGESTYFQHSFRRQHNVLPKFKLPDEWSDRCRGFDHGTASPFCVLWMVTVRGHNIVEINGRERYFSNGSKIIFAEWYGRDSKDRAIGNRYSPSEIAKGIIDRESILGGKIRPGPADNSIWAQLSENSVAREMEKLGVRFIKSDKSKGSRARGWAIMADMFRAAHSDKPEKPALYIFENCVELITDITTLMTDDSNFDDINTAMPDHAADACRYLVATANKGLSIVATSGL